MMKSPPGGTIGHINIRICEEGGLWSGDGNLTINEGGEVASYRLTILPVPAEAHLAGELHGGPGPGPDR
ncbi:hypothetical protein [Candidatus Methanocrinis natronophilus]|uniref:Uncharacterized protein n=1 Tax=Candidatus Methanocrinis natronophilus TaxID=3033396 RepID=A0ABT5X983_9EURY|nr:hypothetical protein [Candidatus Methanocrinis natronophilus]MDF0591271.1 hypothetical protein [Candidatus Methanocrinis natronophilus]